MLMCTYLHHQLRLGDVTVWYSTFRSLIWFAENHFLIIPSLYFKLICHSYDIKLWEWNRSVQQSYLHWYFSLTRPFGLISFWKSDWFIQIWTVSEIGPKHQKWTQKSKLPKFIQKSKLLKIKFRSENPPKPLKWSKIVSTTHDIYHRH